MRFKLLTEIAMTMLKARLKQTLVAAVGVTFGITMFVTLLSFMNGLNNLLDGLIVNRTPHIRLFNEIEPKQNQPIKLIEQYKDDYHFISSVKSSNSRLEIYNSEKIIEALGHDKRVKGVSRKASTQVFFNDGAIDISGILNGIDVDKEISYYKFEDYVTSGKPSDLKNVPNSIILGKPLAEKLLANIGDVIQLTTPQGEKFRMKVMGYYQSGYNDFDKTQSFVSLSNLQKIIGKSSNYVTDIQIKLHDIKDATYMAGEYHEKFEVKAEDIQTANAQFETGTKIRTLISYAVGITLLIVAGFGIYNILNMMIYEK
ncbi:MAG TPA: ABC transporter permease, partial [Saprospiraceae bacterium]|nr:ABC transporter permease [Saprospiraceae bacterium]